jgi:uncharacterized membrane-anchored protein
MDSKATEQRFEPNAFYERLLAMQKRGTLDLTLLSTPTRLALGYYSAAKREAEEMKEK